MPAFEDTLKAKGFTEADLADPNMKRLIDSFRSEYEATLSERDSLKTDYEKYKAQVENEWTPGVNKRIEEEERKVVAARLEAARLQEELKLAREYGLLPPEPTPTPTPTTTPGAFDPKAHNLITKADVLEFANQEARAIAMSYDVGEEYRYLTGKELREYQGSDGSTGMTALLAEAQTARAKSLKEYAAQKFEFAKLRQAKTDAATKAREDAIRSEEREKTRAELAQQYGNPNLRTPAPSRQPFFTPAKPGEQPWNKTENERRTERVNRALFGTPKSAVQ